MHPPGSKEEHGLDILNVENVEDGQPKEIVDAAQIGSRSPSPAERALLRKLDWVVLPVLWLMYFLNFLDRAAITIARLNKMEKDLHLTSVQYQACVSGLFIGYLLGQIPSNMIITRVRPSIFLGSWMALWAICSTLQGIVHSFTGLFLARFFLGFTEAPFYPGALYLLSIFYTRTEIATRISILFSGSVCGNAFASLIAIGVFKMHGVAGLEGWRWLYILQGIITFVVAIISIFILPDEPTNTRWLSPDERELAQSRVSGDTVARRTNTSTWDGLKDAVTDKNLWPSILIQHLGVAASGYKNFLPTVVQTLGYGQTTTLGMTCPPYLVSGALSVLWSWSSGRRNERTWHLSIACTTAIIGFIIASATTNIGARYFSIFVFTTGVYAISGINLGWVASTCGQTKEKRAVSLAVTNTISNIATIYTPYWWPASNGPRYVMPFTISAVFLAVAVLSTFTLRWMLVRANKKIRQTESETQVFYAL